MKYKVVLVEDQYVARQLFGLYLKDSEKYEIVRTLESASWHRGDFEKCTSGSDPDGYPSG